MQHIITAFERGDWAATCQLAAQALARVGGLDLIHISGLARMQAGEFDAGMTLLKAATAFQPSSPHMYSNAAQIAEQLGRIDDLAFFINQGLRPFPDDPKLLRHRGNLHLLRLDYLGALEVYSNLLQRDPDNVDVLINLANTYRLLDDFEMAETLFAKVAMLAPDHSSLRVGRASLYGDLGRVPEAIALLEGVEDWDARYILALFLLGIGEYERGWRLHRDRWHSLLYRGITRPLRACEHLNQVVGQKIVVLREGGFGDVFQFLRYLPALAALADDIIIHAVPSDRSLLQANVPANVTVLTTSSASTTTFEYQVPDACKYTIPLLDLPYLFGTTLDTIPANSGMAYIRAPAANQKACRLPRSPHRRVGLVWAGGSTTGLNQRPYDAQRSIDLRAFGRFTDLTPQIEFVNLQFGPHAEDLGLVTTPVLGENGDWADTAAIIEQLDLVISVDTSVVHLAAAMGKPTWLLSRFNPCWRWLGNRPDSPWYPTVLRVFGQPSYGDWDTVLDAVHAALHAWISSVNSR